MHRSIRLIPSFIRALEPSIFRALELSFIRALAPAVALAALISGCASLQPGADNAEIINSWSGRFALTVTAPDQPEQRNNGSFSLTERKNATELELSTPLGVTIASARIDSSGASLVTAQGKRFEAQSGEDLTEQIFGWRIPVQRLPAWFKGKPSNITELQADPKWPDRPGAGEEDGWSIRYERWNDSRIARVWISYPSRVSLRMVINDQ